jgi:pyruvate ferredoxin oxidoreductase gamma subunit
VAKETIEVRWHGRGGQGAVTASKLLAETALAEGKYFQGMPDYGAERMGAPIKACTRISPEPIKPYCQVTEPNVVVVLDTSLLGIVDVTEGLKRNGVLIVNTTLPPTEVRSKVNYEGKVYTVDGTGISIEALGRNLPNIPMLAALARATNIADKESIASVIKERLGATMKQEVVEANLKAFNRAYVEVQEG